MKLPRFHKNILALVALIAFVAFTPLALSQPPPAKAPAAKRGNNR